MKNNRGSIFDGIGPLRGDGGEQICKHVWQMVFRLVEGSSPPQCGHGEVKRDMNKEKMTEMVVRKMKNFLPGTFVFRVDEEVTSL